MILREVPGISPSMKDVLENSAQRGTYRKKLICIGTSTGGPRALQVVLSSLPSSIKAPILIVQHMPPVFTKSLANRLNTICQIKVKEAEEGEILENGIAYIAPGDFHFLIEEKKNTMMVKLSKSQTVNGHRPSVDVLFQSVSKLKGIDIIAVIMTGMGTDGSKGLKDLSKTGRLKAIAESEESCIVYGMPKAAVATNYVNEVASLEQIALVIMNYMSLKG
ncbi:CheB methylesterase domain-containing protein [Heyndrickxia acidicola]|jgi:two-component system chemotaxis response regulator CheB|uniref:protein-glutamate methylesterase n=1 Tax=Heyndrickxia acidicola TaxID=209389 RepID=A0ABU6MBK8_9BACI|nr:CheB methylesterase domain-containing protein [Heyndrickxia acidicola]MED1202054.1 CheB methylesterase domain-containing protein [Heyndrickxia acidicola]